jgi:putative photosynthetic complex assembly protein
MPQLKTLADRKFNKSNPERDMIPRTLLWGMLALALSTLALVTISVVTDRPHVGVPPTATVVREANFILEGLSAQAVIVKDEQGNVLLDLPHGGFVTVIQSGMARARLVAQTVGNPSMKVVEYSNGRLVAEDPATGWSAELYAFGGDNEESFRKLLVQTQK